jgi:hypothetical protein
LQTVHNEKFSAVCVPLNFRLFTKVLSIPPPTNVPVSLTALPSTPDTNTFKSFEMGAEWEIVNGTKVKVKQPRNRPGVAQRVPGGLGSQIS